jgi:hypothetical protein
MDHYARTENSTVTGKKKYYIQDYSPISPEKSNSLQPAASVSDFAKELMWWPEQKKDLECVQSLFLCGR